MMICLKPRHSRGLFVLALVGLSESVALVQALQWGSTSLPPPWTTTASSKSHTDTSCLTATSSLKKTTSRGKSLWRAIIHPFQPKKAREPKHMMTSSLSSLLSSGMTACAALPRGGAHSHAHAHGHGSTCTDHVSSSLTPYGIPLPLWKVLFQAFLTVMNVLCWYWPLKSKRISDNRLLLSLANAFSGGVFLSLALGHLIPECVHGFDPKVWNEATPYWCVLAGYLLIFFVEKVAFDAHDIMHNMQQQDGSHSHAHSHSHSHGHSHTPPMINGHAKESSVTTTFTSNSSINSNSNNSPTTTTTVPTGRSCLILLGALGVHSVLEMMALGLVDTFGDGALLTTSIALHQPAESLALLVAFLKSGMPQDQIIRYLSIFSAMGPIGVALGMAVNEYAAPIVDSILLAIVAGTFVYVGATEVIPEEWETPENKWKKFGALLSGIAFIYAVTQYTHSLGGGHH